MRRHYNALSSSWGFDSDAAMQYLLIIVYRESGRSGGVLICGLKPFQKSPGLNQATTSAADSVWWLQAHGISWLDQLPEYWPRLNAEMASK